MPIFKKNNKTILFLHIPKTGGKTVASVMQYNGWKMLATSNLDEHNSLIYLPYRELSLLFGDYINKFDFIFTVVRNPYDRIKSEYNWIKAQDPFEEWFTNALKRYNINNSYSDNHFRPQIDYSASNVTVYKFELGYNHIFSSIEQKLNTKIKSKNTCLNVSKKLLSLTEFDKELIYNQYKQDFISFGYTK